MKVVTRHKRFIAPAFTLIEILVVIGIILVLATMTIGGLGWYKRRAAVGRTEVLLKAIDQSLESYRSDNGFLPQGMGDDDSSAQVYIALYGDGELEYDSTGKVVTIKTQSDGEPDSGATIHLDMLNPGFTGSKRNVTSVGGKYTIIDAWSKPIRYRHDVTGEDDQMMNPPDDFDLWSLGPDGLGGPDGGNQKERNDDIKNW